MSQTYTLQLEGLTADDIKIIRDGLRKYARDAYDNDSAWFDAHSKAKAEGNTKRADSCWDRSERWSARYDRAYELRTQIAHQQTQQETE